MNFCELLSWWWQVAKLQFKKRSNSGEIKSLHPRSLFSALFETFCLTARAYLNTQKYGLFCSLGKGRPPAPPFPAYAFKFFLRILMQALPFCLLWNKRKWFMQRTVFIRVTFDLMLVALLLFKWTMEYETFFPRFCSRLAFSSFSQSVIFTWLISILCMNQIVL